MNHYHTMGKEKLEREYSPSSCIDDIAVPLSKYRNLSRVAREKLKDQCHRNIKYGPEKRAHMDIFIPKGDGSFPVHIFIHGGYWQELSKEESSFAASNFLDHDIIFIALDYTLAPKARLTHITDQVRRALRWILGHIDTYGGDKNNITLSGNSAGAHLVAEILSDLDDHSPIKGACIISGIYDLRPLVLTYVNDLLGLSMAEAIAASPLFHIPKTACPVIFSYGENETDEFKRQTEVYKDAWQKAGHKASFIPMPGFNHFDIILELNNKNSPLFKAILDQITS
ncbi:hypothetical protein MNBD_ALPHA02-2067 [hydrothermal vent metagenome]|uniref:BD-FAE-like domain-containing protein n=1 Tax=hydrothermal vent metagenome TaxID=652676 RepID=A0A3B0SCG0_9ZZZZ